MSMISTSAGKGRFGKSVGPFLKQTGVLVMEDTVKVELVNAFFALVFTAEVVLQESQTTDVRGRLEKGTLPAGHRGFS